MALSVGTVTRGSLRIPGFRGIPAPGLTSASAWGQLAPTQAAVRLEPPVSAGESTSFRAAVQAASGLRTCSLPPALPEQVTQECFTPLSGAVSQRSGPEVKTTQVEGPAQGNLCPSTARGPSDPTSPSPRRSFKSPRAQQ